MMNFLRKIKVLILKNKILVFLIFSFIGLYSYLILWRHNTFQSHAFDLGIYDQIIWLYSRFKVPYSTIRELILIGDHFHPILVFFVPFYWIWADPRMLLILQIFLAVFSVIPIYAIAEDKFKNRFFSVLMTLGYLTFYGLQEAIAFDFHVATISIFFLSFLLYAYHFKKKGLFWIFFILTLVCKEDMALVLLMLGVYDFLFKKNFKRGLVIFFVSLVTFLVYIKVISPYFNPASGQYFGIIFPGETFLEKITYVITKPIESWKLVFIGEKIRAMEFVMVPFSFLFMFSPMAIMMFLPLWAERFLSTIGLRWLVGFHYSVNALPILAVGLIYGLSNLSEILKKLKIEIEEKRLVFFFGSMFLICNLFMTHFEKGLFSWYWQKDLKIEKEKQLEFQEIFEMIPEEASVMTQDSLVSHLSEREKVYLYPKKMGEVDYILLSMEVSGYSRWVLKIEPSMIEELRMNGDYELVYRVRETYLFKRRET